MQLLLMSSCLEFTILNKVNGVIVSGSAGTLANVGTYADDVIGLKSGAHQLVPRGR